MTLNRFLTLAEKWDALGSSVQQQLSNVADGADLDEQSNNALAMIETFLRDASDHLEDFEANYIAEQINEYLHDDDEEDAQIAEDLLDLEEQTKQALSPATA